MVTLSSSVNIAESLSSELKREKYERRQCLLKIISNIKFLARQGLPLRGHGDESDSNFMQLMKLRAEDNAQIISWLEKKTDKYIHHLRCKMKFLRPWPCKFFVL